MINMIGSIFKLDSKKNKNYCKFKNFYGTSLINFTSFDFNIYYSGNLNEKRQFWQQFNFIRKENQIIEVNTLQNFD